MTRSVAEQLHCLLGALLWGLAAGLWYDLLRVLRYRVGKVAVTILLDLLFWLTATAVLFLWCIDAGDGKVQVSVCAALFVGGVLYFRFCSRFCLPLLTGATALLAKLLALVTLPIRAVLAQLRKLGKLKKFFDNFRKKHFSFRGK